MMLHALYALGGALCLLLSGIFAGLSAVFDLGSPGIKASTRVALACMAAWAVLAVVGVVLWRMA